MGAAHLYPIYLITMRAEPLAIEMLAKLGSAPPKAVEPDIT